MDIDGEERERIKKYRVVFLTGGSEATNPENMETYMHMYGLGVRKKMTE